MKKVLSLMMVGLLACSMLIFSGCGDKDGDAGTNDVTGTKWVLSGGSQGDIKVSKEDLETLMGGEMSYTFEADGKLIASAAGVETEGTWSQDGNTVTVDIGGQSADMTMDGDTLSLVQGEVTITLTKE